ncbi:MAG: hypothetical protein A2Y38_14455 [Spirochaetes bacterium GWB1_59_5]|nr:MAG: hypothetical protein A2Y38_14455 [Spirochaetes bacterium GWB1_59_5]
MQNIFLRLSRLFTGNNAESAAPAAANAASVACNLVQDAEGWIDVAIPGEFDWVDSNGRIIGRELVAAEDMAAVVADAANKAQAPNWTGFPIWEGHPHDGPARGWFRQARVQNGTLQVLPEWSPDGLKLVVENKAYKFGSVSWGGVKDSAGKFRPREFIHLGLTNRPNMKGLAPIVNAAPEPAAADPAPGAEPSVSSVPPVPPAPADNTAALTELRTLVRGLSDTLGVPAPVGEGGAIAAVDLVTAAQAVQSAANRVPELQTALGAARADLAALNTRFDQFVVEQAIARRIVAADRRPCALRIIAQNRDAAIDYWFHAPAAPTRELPRNPLAGHNALPAGLPRVTAVNGGGARQPDAQQLAAAVAEYQEQHPGCAYQAAFNAVYGAAATSQPRQEPDPA